MKEKLKNKFLGISEPSDNKLRSAIILFVWIVLLSSLIAYIRVYRANNPIEEVKSFNSLGDIFDKYKDYDYEISIKDVEGNKVVYKGTFKNTINTGTKVDGDNSFDYKVENNIIKDTTNDIELESLYDGYLSYFFFPQNIYTYVSYLKSEEREDNGIKVYLYKYTYDDKDITFDIETTFDKLNNIVMSYDDKIYEMKFIK